METSSVDIPTILVPMLTVAILVLVLMGAPLYFYMAQGRRARKAADDIKKTMDELYVPRHEYRRVDARDFPKVDRRFYDKTQRLLEAEGFRFLADEENVTIKNSSMNPRTFIRVMLSQDGTIAAGLYHPKPPLWIVLLCRLGGGRIDRTVDMETEFDDGSFVCTSNAEIAAAMTPPPQIRVEYLPVGAPALDVLARHRERVVDWRVKHPDLTPLAFGNLDQVHDSQHRMEAIKAGHRRELGGVTREELYRCSGADKTAADEVFAELKRQNRNR